MTPPPTGKLAEPVLEALRELRAAFPDAQMSLIGASALAFNMEDEITRDTMMTRGGEVVHARAK